jgi:hypothetical protein
VNRAQSISLLALANVAHSNPKIIIFSCHFPETEPGLFEIIWVLLEA